MTCVRLFDCIVFAGTPLLDNFVVAWTNSRQYPACDKSTPTGFQFETWVRHILTEAQGRAKTIAIVQALQHSIHEFGARGRGAFTRFAALVIMKGASDVAFDFARWNRALLQGLGPENAPHATTTTHADQLNADLLELINS